MMPELGPSIEGSPLIGLPQYCLGLTQYCLVTLASLAVSALFAESEPPRASDLHRNVEKINLQQQPQRSHSIHN